MSAIVVVSMGSNASAAAGVGVLIALGVLVAHLGAYRPAKVKRMVSGVLIAGSLATVAAPVAKADDDTGIVMIDPCKDLTPSDPMYWVLGCFWPL